MKLYQWTISAIAIALSLLATPAFSQPLSEKDFNYFSTSQIKRDFHLKKVRQKKNAPFRAIFVKPKKPFEFIDVAPEKLRVFQSKKESHWELPPWQAIEPSLNLNTLNPKSAPQAPPQPSAWSEISTGSSSDPASWSDISVVQASNQTSVASFQPLPKTSQRDLTPKDLDLEPPSQFKAFTQQNQTVLRISWYQGPSWLQAKHAYLTLEHACEEKTDLEGIGKNAFMAETKVFEHPSAQALQQYRRDLQLWQDKKQRFTLNPFRQIQPAPKEAKKSKSSAPSPVFTEILAPEEKKPLHYTAQVEKKHLIQKPHKPVKKLQTTWNTLVVYYEELGVTLEISGDPQKVDFQQLIDSARGFEHRFSRK